MKIHESWGVAINMPEVKNQLLNLVAELYHQFNSVSGASAVRDKLAEVHGRVSREDRVGPYAQSMLQEVEALMTEHFKEHLGE